MDLRTKCQKKREAREMAIYRDYNALMSEPYATQKMVNELLMAKYKIYSTSTLWAIRKRVEERLKKEGGKK